MKPHLQDLRSYVQWFDHALAPEFCTRMIEAFQQMPQFQTPNGRGFRKGWENSGWTELDITPHADAAFKGYFYDQIAKYLKLYNDSLGLTLAVPESPQLEELRIKRYRANSDEGFQPHFDAADEKCKRFMVFLWYLNDVREGGQTEFCDLGLTVDARAGRLLMFPPFWMFQHAGLTPLSNDKYIVSTYMLFDPAPRKSSQ
ncbi:MAG: 2OG-Fe(II) oxygenase [Rudaea sp.]